MLKTMRVITREPDRLSVRLEPVGALLAGVLCGAVGAMAILVRLDVILSIFGAGFLAFAALCIWRMRFVLLTINLESGQVFVKRWGVMGADRDRTFPVSVFTGLTLEERQHRFNGESEGSSYRLAVNTLEGHWPLVEDYDFDRENKLVAVRLVQAFLDAQIVRASSDQIAG
jgi:hypothetical protein